MNRLSEQTSSTDPAAVRLTELVRNAPRFRENPFRKRKLLLRMRRAAEARTLTLRKPAFAAMVVAALGTAGIAAASYGWFGHRPPPPVADRAPPPLPAPATPQPHLHPTVAPEFAEPSPSAQVVTAKPAASSTPRRAERALASRARPKDDGEDPAEVLEAIRALRKQGNAARAQILLDQYLRTHPTGALSEDALVLSIEAALARRDPRAADYAKRYLKNFPKGRFRSLAERVLASRP